MHTSPSSLDHTHLIHHDTNVMQPFRRRCNPHGIFIDINDEHILNDHAHTSWYEPTRPHKMCNITCYCMVWFSIVRTTRVGHCTLAAWQCLYCTLAACCTLPSMKLCCDRDHMHLGVSCIVVLWQDQFRLWMYRQMYNIAAHNIII